MEIGVGKSHRGMADPGFGLLKFSEIFCYGFIVFLHGVEVGVHALGFVEPLFLAGVAGEHVAFHLCGGGDVDDSVSGDFFAERAHQAVRHRVINSRGFVVGRGWRLDLEIHHSTTKGCGDSEAGCILMVFHVVAKRMGEDDVGLDRSHASSDTADAGSIVKNMQVVEERGVEGRVGKEGGGAGFADAQCNRVLGQEGGCAAVAGGEVPHVDFAACVAEEQESAGHAELDVIRVTGDGQGNHFF